MKSSFVEVPAVRNVVVGLKMLSIVDSSEEISVLVPVVVLALRF